MGVGGGGSLHGLKFEYGMVVGGGRWGVGISGGVGGGGGRLGSGDGGLGGEGGRVGVVRSPHGLKIRWILIFVSNIWRLLSDTSKMAGRVCLTGMGD